MNFKSLQSKMLFYFLGIMVGLQGLTFALIHLSGQTIAKQARQDELVLAKKAFDDFMVMQTDSLLKQTRLMASDFALKEAYSTQDNLTIQSAIRNHQQRIGAPVMLIIDRRTKVQFRGLGPELESAMFSPLAKEGSSPTEKTFFLKHEARIYQMVAVPLKAPVAVAWVIVGFDVANIFTQKFYQTSGLEVELVYSEGGAWQELNAAKANYDPSKTIITRLGASSSGYAALISKSKDGVTQPIDELKSRLGVFFCFSLLVFAGLAVYISRGLTLPLQRLSEIAGHIARGDFAQNIRRESADEIGDLQASIDKMAKGLKFLVDENQRAFSRLEESYKEQEITSQILDRKLFETSVLLEVAEISRVHISLEDLLESVLAMLLERFSLSRGSVFMADREIHRLKCHMALIREELTDRVHRFTAYNQRILSLTEGIAGKVIETREPAWSENINHDVDFVKFDSKEEVASQFLCVPLVVKDQCIGILNLSGEPKKSTMTKNDLSFFTTLASHMAFILDNQKLYLDSITDGMTGLFNHKYFLHLLHQVIATSRSDRAQFCLILFDLDFFKKFNDTYGHQLGDEVIKQTAAVAQASVRVGDLVCRYGGEEFAIILPRTNGDEALEVAERLRQSVEAQPILHKNKELQVTISVGLSVFKGSTEEEGGDAQSIIAQADEALYEAKKAGRNTIRIFEIEDKVRAAS